jgi:hypothetical protein
MVKTVMKFGNPTPMCFVNGGQSGDGTAGAEMLMCNRRSYLSLNDILPHLGNNMIDNIREELDDDGETQGPKIR